MHVLFLDQFSELGGAQRCLLDLLPEIETRGWRASAALPGNGPLVDLLRARGVRVHQIPCGPYRSGRKSVSDMLRFIRDVQGQVSILRQLKFDLLYVNGPRALPGAAIAFGSSRPALFHAHSRVSSRFEDWLERWSIRRADATVVSCARAVAPSVRPDRLRVVANGTPDLGVRERPVAGWRIGIIGRISPEKGQLEFLRAATILAREFEGARFVLCGAPISQHGKYLRQVQKYADCLPLDLLGWQDDVAPVLAELDLLVIASKAEGMPRVMLEAFSAGVPVVAFPVGGIPEVITDGKTGFLVHERTAEALAARIREIILPGHEPLQRVIAKARREWETKYTVDHYRKNITAVMEHLVSDRPAAREIESPPLSR
jgi:glycosyltransferase involved in cell wall biosynthesis